MPLTMKRLQDVVNYEPLTGRLTDGVTRKPLTEAACESICQLIQRQAGGTSGIAWAALYWAVFYLWPPYSTVPMNPVRSSLVHEINSRS